MRFLACSIRKGDYGSRFLYRQNKGVPGTHTPSRNSPTPNTAYCAHCIVERCRQWGAVEAMSDVVIIHARLLHGIRVSPLLKHADARHHIKMRPTAWPRGRADIPPRVRSRQNGCFGSVCGPRYGVGGAMCGTVSAVYCARVYLTETLRKPGARGRPTC